MARYIDANELLRNTIYNVRHVPYITESDVTFAPTADVVERKHGKWIMHIDDLFPVESTMECSKCHHEQSLIIDDNFCPNCGADMRKETEDEET